MNNDYDDETRDRMISETGGFKYYIIALLILMIILKFVEPLQN